LSGPAEGSCPRKSFLPFCLDRGFPWPMWVDALWV
jgi:hypothetical protein